MKLTKSQWVAMIVLPVLNGGPGLVLSNIFDIHGAKLAAFVIPWMGCVIPINIWILRRLHPKSDPSPGD